MEKDRKKRDLEERTFEEKMEMQRWAECRVKSKEVEIKKVRDEIMEKEERLKEEVKEHRRTKEEFEEKMKGDKEVIDMLEKKERILEDEIEELSRREEMDFDEIERLNKVLKEGQSEIERLSSINNSLIKINQMLEQKMDVMRDVVQGEAAVEGEKEKGMLKKREESPSPDRGRAKERQDRNAGGRGTSMARAMSKGRYRSEMEKIRVERFRGEQNCWQHMRGGCKYGERCQYFHPRNREEMKPVKVLCTEWVKGECRVGDKCRFYHCEEDKKDEEKEGRNDGEREGRMGAGRGRGWRGSDEGKPGAGRGEVKKFSFMDLIGKEQRSSGIGRGGYPAGREDGKMGQYLQMEKKGEGKAHLEKETKKEESNEKLGEEGQEMEIPTRLIEAIAKKIKEMD